MTGNSVLIDTNIVIELFKGNKLVQKKLENTKSIYIPFVVLGELYLGAYKSSNSIKHITQINEFLKTCTVLNGDEETANHYGLIKTYLLKKGKPIPENDIWIASIAKQHKIKLLTFDKHFLEISSIELEKTSL